MHILLIVVIVMRMAFLIRLGKFYWNIGVILSLVVFLSKFILWMRILVLVCKIKMMLIIVMQSIRMKPKWIHKKSKYLHLAKKKQMKYNKKNPNQYILEIKDYQRDLQHANVYQ